MKPVTLYSTTNCGYCRRAKQLLQERGIPFVENNVEDDHERRAWLVKKTGRRTVPQIFIGDEPIGGYTELRALDQSGELLSKLV